MAWNLLNLEGSEMIDISVANFVTVGIMSALFMALWHWAAGIIAG